MRVTRIVPKKQINLMNNCPFCIIAQKQSPSLVISEDESCLAFLPLEPEAYAHTLVIPKQHFQTINDIQPNVLAQTFCFCRNLALRYTAKLGCAGFNILLASGQAAQQSVPHFHIHLIPRFEEDGLDAWPVLKKSSIDRQQMYSELKSRLDL